MARLRESRYCAEQTVERRRTAVEIRMFMV
jgi:hypothetical protein